MMAMRFRFSSVTSTGGQQVALKAAGLTCIVGPNNAGKSQMLRELRGAAHSDESDRENIVLADIQAALPVGSAEDAASWLSLHAIRYDTQPGMAPTFAMHSEERGISATEFASWATGDNFGGNAYLGNIAHFFIEYVAAGTARQYVAGHLGDRGENHALARMRASGELEEVVSDVIFQAFGERITVDRLDFQTSLRVGEVAVEVPPLNRPTVEYQEALAALPLIDSQGDGFRSFVGLVAYFITHEFGVWLIDEPEAFLHPGQTRVLGQWIAEEAVKRGVQVIVATHDRDFIIGALSAKDSDVSIVRLTREGERTRFDHLSSEEIVGVWSRPLLRYSNVLQGLFHLQVVVCEGDGDCRFYSAALESASSRRGRRAMGDALFIPSAGKGALSNMVDAVTKVGVEAWVIADFDLVRNKTDLKKTLEAVGGEWSEDLNAMYTAMMKEANESPDGVRLKKTGLGFFLRPDSLAAATEIVRVLMKSRLLLVPVGELESFDRTLGADKDVWLGKALEARLYESQSVQDFVGSILGSAVAETQAVGDS